MEQDKTKVCTFCGKEIHALATKCLYCQSEIKGVFTKKRSGYWLLGIFAFLFFVSAIVLSSNNNSSSTGSSSVNSAPPDNSDLNVSVQTNGKGMYITNKESSDWTNCMVGVNGSDGWGFDNPPYQTRNLVTLIHNQENFIPFTKITTSDGTQFDPSTQTINTSVIECFKGTPGARYWQGHNSN